jgi:hypothetical protein
MIQEEKEEGKDDFGEYFFIPVDKLIKTLFELPLQLNLLSSSSVSSQYIL